MFGKIWIKFSNVLIIHLIMFSMGTGTFYAAESTAQTSAEADTQEDTTYSVCIDPGHQGSWVDMSAQEAEAPGSSVRKTKSSAGTVGTTTGVCEYQLNLDIALLVRNELENRGYRVVMTRENNDTAISNSERAKLAASSGCDITVRIHANGSEDSSVKGALAMIGSRSNPYVSSLYDDSYLLANDVLNSYCSETGFKNLGLQFTDDMTGINWSTIPVMILEMGYMTNPEDDLAMQDPVTRGKMVNGITEGIEKYFRDKYGQIPETEKRTEEETESVSETVVKPPEIKEKGKTKETKQNYPAEYTEMGPVSDIYKNYLASREKNGEVWAVGLKNLENGKTYGYNCRKVMQTASVIKVFIMGAVYDRVLYPAAKSQRINYQESYDGELKSLLTAMITVSDNESANQLVEILGGGDFEAGMKVVNNFCQKYGYKDTSLGRKFMETNPSGDNYSSAADCCRILSDIYSGKCVSRKASAQMMKLLKAQEQTWKIPAGLPKGFSSANKTGEMPEGYGLGCIENDIAIIFSPYGDYILSILSNNLNGKNEEADAVITQISSDAAQWAKGNLQETGEE